MSTSQDFLPVEDIKKNLLFLKNGGVTLVITTTAVNFELLFETEQMSLIESFAGLLNSLSFPIQIVVRSRRLDVSSYLRNLDKAIQIQTTPLLRTMTIRYRNFVESIIKENNVLDKQFYVCLNVSAPELGFISSHSINEDKIKKAATVLNPRRDHILRQLGRLGLKARQLNSEELVKLYYDIYNTESVVSSVYNGDLSENTASDTEKASITPLQSPAALPPENKAAVSVPNTPNPTNPRPVRPFSAQFLNPSRPVNILPKQPPVISPQTQNITLPPASLTPLTPPFIVEELADDFGP